MKYLYWLPPYVGVYLGLYVLKSAWAALIGFHIGIIFVLLIHKNVTLRERLTSTEGSQPIMSEMLRQKTAQHDTLFSILFKSKKFKWVLINLIFCGGSGLGIYFLKDIFGISENLSIQLAELGLNQFTWIPFIAYFSLINPFVEEYFWRGVFGSDSKNFYFGDLAYAGYHGLVLFNRVHPLSVLFAITCLAFIGWFWRKVKREDEGLLAPVLGHMVADFSILTAVYFL